MSVFIVLAVRPFDEGKTRLAAVLTSAARRALCERLYRHVLTVAIQVLPATQVLVVSRSESVRQIARDACAIAISETGFDLNQALSQGADRCRDLSAKAILTLAGDLPELAPCELLRMIDRQHGNQAVIAPDRHGRGTNALLVPANSAIRYRYGKDSFLLHQQAAKAAGLCITPIHRPGLALDIDWLEDLRDWYGFVGQPFYPEEITA
ncbi:MAG: cofC [Nevskia sp.]|nr:cofC [Nevskia sp.]